MGRKTANQLTEETVLLAQKYNDYLVANDLKFTHFDLKHLRLTLSGKRKDQIVEENKKVLEMFNYIKTLNN